MPTQRPAQRSISLRSGLRVRRNMARALVAAWACTAMLAQAQEVVYSGRLGKDKALLVIDGQLRTVAVGAKVSGVSLRQLNSDSAVLDIGGHAVELRMGASPVNLGGVAAAPIPAAPVQEQKVVLPIGPDGHAFSQGWINGKPVQLMVDTGATTITIGQSDARRLGLRLDGGQRGMASTAGGIVALTEVQLDSVRLGNVEVRKLSASVLQTDMPFVLLGNNFLSRFSMQREGEEMRLQLRP